MGLHLGISRIGSGSGRAIENPTENLLTRTRPWPDQKSKSWPEPAHGPTRRPAGQPDDPTAIHFQPKIILLGTILLLPGSLLLR